MNNFLPAEATPSPVADLELDKLFQVSFAQITGLPGAMVRPRWQSVPPKQPEQNQDWMAVGTPTIEADENPTLETKSEEPGSVRSLRWEQLSTLVTTYGPNAYANAALLRDGLGIPNNREALDAAHIGYVGAGAIRAYPELINQIWVRRYDMVLTFRRRVERIYGIHTITSATVHLVDDTHVDDTITVPPL